MQTLTVDIEEGEEFLTLDNEYHAIILGGNDTNPTWDEYLDGFKEGSQKYFKLIKQYLEENDMVGFCSDEFNTNDKHFVFSDGQKIGFSMRAWGDLMQAIVGKREGYMTYYMK